VSDASAEAERLISALRARGYQVVDVPLGLLVNRVSVQRPALILCDADAPGAVESVERIHRDVPGGHRVDVVFVRERSSQSNADLTSIIEREGSGCFERPVDDAALTRKVEALIGLPTRNDRPRLAAGGRAPILVAATRRPFRYDQKSGGSVAPEAPPPSQPPKSSTWIAPAPLPSAPPSSPGSSPLSSPEPSSLRRDDPPMSVAPSVAQLPQARLSPELEMLLGRAEQRVSQGRASVAPPSDRLSPEAELEAILPADLLASLDEPLDLDDGDESDAGPSTHGGGEDRSGTRNTATGGTKTGQVTGSRAPAQITGAEAADDASATADPRPPTEPPPSRETEPPKTPPAMPLRLNTGVGSEPAPPPSEADQRVTSAGVPSDMPPASLPRGANGSAAPPHQASTKPPKATLSEPQHEVPIAPAISAPDVAILRADAFPSVRAVSSPTAPNGNQSLELPTTLRTGEAVRCLALAVRSRYTGAVAFENGAGIRRVVFRDGDFVTAATSADEESLVACLMERGSLPADAASKLGRKLPLFGRHAGAALIAHGYLQQDELWPVLRSHAEWLIGRIARLERAETGVESEIPARLATEPAVFGGATGAEVLVDIVRRVSPPDVSAQRLGGVGVRLQVGSGRNLLGECALAAEEAELVRSLDGETLGDTLGRAKSNDFASVLLALVELGIVDASAATSPVRRHLEAPPAKVEPDRLDHEALRSRIAARRALVDEGDYFALLGVSRSATSYDVRRAYTELREALDPGRVLTPATADLRDDVDAILVVIDEAYEILADDLRRERYRRALEAAPG
jgi:hypothetical protein